MLVRRFARLSRLVLLACLASSPALADALDEIKSKGTTILLVEQNAHAALGHSDRAYVLETGRIVMEGPSKDLANDPRIKEAYLGE